MVNVFAVELFFIVFRQCLEVIILLSVLFSFLKQCLGQPDQDQVAYKRLRRQVWFGTFTGIGLCLVIGGAFIGVFYRLGTDIWSQAEDLWIGIFYLIATIILTVVGIALLRTNKLREDWRVKIAQSLAGRTQAEKHSNLFERRQHVTSWLGDLSRRYMMFILPFITTMREGVEAVVFIGGVSLSLPASAFPLPVICGVFAAVAVGYLLYRGGNSLPIQIFMIASSSLLSLIAAGMFSKSIWSLQYYAFAQQIEEGNTVPSYNILESVWHVNCCDPEADYGWDIFNAILGWQNSATYGSIISYNVYWIGLIVALGCLLYEERTGELPFRRRALSCMVRIPGFKSYAEKRLKRKNVDSDAAIEEIGTEDSVNVAAARETR